MKKLAIASLIVASAVMIGCTATEQGAGYGGLGGAAIGGALGGWQGAAIGAGAGALTGALVGNAVDNSDNRPPPPPPPPPPGAGPGAPPGGFPVGIRTDRPGLVRSPYNPNGPLVDVTGYGTGTLVQDPTTGKNFVVP